mmetsp:Transcript_1144/g.2652  ORF Transcript_1144/g.2652 Transcript_1144/m.2652 type:complete len:149 (-) Transcript_1144:94-540(-)
MFFSKLAESSGLYEILAPIKRAFAAEDNADADRKIRSAVEPGAIRKRRLDAQRKAEQDAEANGVFAKKQRVQYRNKANNTICDAVVVGVHFDDGLDKPYYTIRYKKQSEEEKQDGMKRVSVVDVEKQTNPDRLTRVPWNEEATWKIIQ